MRVTSFEERMFRNRSFYVPEVEVLVPHQACIKFNKEVSHACKVVVIVACVFFALSHFKLKAKLSPLAVAL